MCHDCMHAHAPLCNCYMHHEAQSMQHLPHDDQLTLLYLYNRWWSISQTHPQDDIFRYNGYLSLMDFRELTLQRLKKVVSQKFFSVRDYSTSESCCQIFCCHVPLGQAIWQADAALKLHSASDRCCTIRPSLLGKDISGTWSCQAI